MNGRVPIIAVSASLIEKQKSHYMESGFDGWILKPIAFGRLSEIMEGIVDRQVRRENLYQPGSWERGGWFSNVQKDLFAANTKPSEKPPQTTPSDGVKIAAAIDDPQVKEESNSEQTHEQTRLAKEQDAGKAEPDTTAERAGNEATTTSVQD